MTELHSYRALTDRDIAALKQNGCAVENDDWTRVQVAGEFDPARIIDTHFGGQVRLGAVSGVTQTSPPKPAAIQHACIIDCVVGDHVRIVNVGVHIANYQIGDGAVIENVGTLETRTGAKFGNGVEIEVLNEGGGREVILFDELSSQFAYLLCLHRYRPRLIARLRELAESAARAVHAAQGRIGAGATIRSVTELIDVHVGPAAIVNGAMSLVNGSILSCPEAPTLVGPGCAGGELHHRRRRRVSPAVLCWPRRTSGKVPRSAGSSRPRGACCSPTARRFTGKPAVCSPVPTP